LIVPIATIIYIALYALGNHYAFDSATTSTLRGPQGLVDARTLIGATLVGLSMFSTLFLASVVGVFLTFNAVRGDAETGILQGMVVRPIGRGSYLLGRYMGAAGVAVVYAVLLFFSSVVTTSWIGHWSPTQPLLSAVCLAAGVALVTALSLVGSVFMTTTANGIAVFMLYGAGLLAGLLGQVGNTIGSENLERIGTIGSWVLPFEAVYQAGLATLTSGATGITRVIVQLGPLGGAQQGGGGLAPYVVVYLLAIGGLGLMSFARRDL
jgi:ABC-type transport system involved in multi-copper enzyme maturation permease subunit